jgi:predicted DNA-binding transcriptional regulator AlpA
MPQKRAVVVPSQPPSQVDLLAKQLLTEDELIQLLGITRRRLIDWKTRRIAPPRVQLQKRILYRTSTVLEWIGEHEEKPLRRSRVSASAVRQ